MLNIKNKKILCVSAHLDDIEFGCGGFISKFCKDADFFVFGTTLNRRSYHGKIQEERLLDEQYAALDVLGVPKKHFFSNNEICGQMLPEYRQLVLEELYRVGAEIKPDLVLVPSYNDIHQDHRTIAWAARKAFKRVSLWGYEIVNSSTGFSPNLYTALEKEHLQKKADAVACYKSQQSESVTTADYFSYEVIYSLAVAHGARAGCRLAEAFEVYSLYL